MKVRRTILRPMVLAVVVAVFTAGGAAQIALGRAGARPVVAERVPAPVSPDVLRVPAGGETDAKDAARAGSPDARSIVYLAKNDVHVMDVATGSVKQITETGETDFAWNPRFRDANTVSWVNGQGLMIATVDGGIDGGEPSLFTAAQSIIAYGWSPGGHEVAFLTSEWLEAQMVVRTSLVVVGGDGSREKRDLDLILPEGYCGGGPDGDKAVSYSPDGRRIMIEHEAAGSAPTAVVIRREGLAHESLNHWAWARFLPDSTIIARQAGAWVRVTSSGTEPLPVPAAAQRVAVSPDGTSVAYDQPGRRPSLRTVRLDDGTVTIIAKNFVAPMWLSADAVVGFATESCTECGGTWTAAGYAQRFDGTEGGETLHFDTPGQIDVLFG